mmetsp:Transcript_94327/g.262487  ORF Transcript_94327/g.262487 Transcript_94327/m.262487 type:complete len:705 (+) Transcript_94327:94-2208(+)
MPLAMSILRPLLLLHAAGASAGMASSGAAPRQSAAGACPEAEETQLLQVTNPSAAHRGHEVSALVASSPGCPGASCGAIGCPGFAVCPTEFPLPYTGKYPDSYPYKPGRFFPAGFRWGLGTAAYQIEGAYQQDGRGASIWDTFSGANTVGMPGAVCKRAPCPVSSVMGIKGATGNVANDFYNKYKEDIAMMASMGLKNYRFSIAWPRVVPTGVFEDGVNREAVQFYHNVIDELVASGIEPVVTMYHWDLPQGLLDFEWTSKIPTCDSRYRQGWYECLDGTSANPQPAGLQGFVVTQFAKYAELLLKEYGSKVKYWFTFNEAWTFTFLGSGQRGKAPNVQPWMDVEVWPYVAGHNVIMAHAKTAEIFSKMQEQGALCDEAVLSMANNQDWQEPQTNTPSDIAAAEYSVEGQLGWYCDPVFGVDGVHDYPRSMRMTLPYLPNFTARERALLKAHRPRLFGLNHYGTAFTRFNCSGTGTAFSSCTNRDGLAQAVSVWLYQAGWGFRKLLNWVANRYGRDLTIWVTEAGWSDNTISALQGRYDTGRTMYYASYISEMWNAINVDGVKVEGFMAWSLMDNYEWERGFAERFGNLWTDFNCGQDPNAPEPSTPIYHPDGPTVNGQCGSACLEENVCKPDPTKAANQTRHPRNTIFWMQWVWQTNAVVDYAPFLAGTIGGDVCYGTGVYQGEVQCALSSPLPGPAPAAAWS